MSAAFDTSDVQQLILHGYDLNYVRYFMLTVVSPVEAREFIGKIAAEFFATTKSATQPLAVAFTYAGLNAFELPVASLRLFQRHAPEFCKGAAQRAASIGDTGANEPARWDPQFISSKCHVLLSIYADDEIARDKIENALTADRPTAGGMTGWDRPIDGKHLGEPMARTEPFGFRDGISQPIVIGTEQDVREDNYSGMRVKPGEILLGHPNQDGENRWGSNHVDDTSGRLVKNGSFAAFRKMRQDVERFKITYPDPMTRAKICGRWPKGAVVEPGVTAEPEAIPQNLNDFDYSNDKLGEGCPFGSHMRRLNPRSDPAASGRKRVVMRRSVPYKDSTSGEQGLLGLFLCANLAMQFEFLLAQWVQTPPMISSAEHPCADPLIGVQIDPQATFVMPGEKGSTIHPSLSPFVTTKGMLYLFYPSKTALKMMGSNPKVDVGYAGAES